MREELVDAYDNLCASRRINRILRWDIFLNEAFLVQRMIQVYLKSEKAKHGNWSSPCTVIEINTNGCLVVIPGWAGKQMSNVFENTRVASIESDLASLVQNKIKQIHENLNFKVGYWATKNTQHDSLKTQCHRGLMMISLTTVTSITGSLTNSALLTKYECLALGDHLLHRQSDWCGCGLNVRCYVRQK